MNLEGESRWKKPILVFITPSVFIFSGGVIGVIGKFIIDSSGDNDSLLELGRGLNELSFILGILGVLFLGVFLLFGPIIGRIIRGEW